MAEGSHFTLVEVFNEGVIRGGAGGASLLLPFHYLVSMGDFGVPAELADGGALAPV